MRRIIIHLDMDAFFAQIEERENPRFRGLPVVVGADPKEGRGRGVVSTANYEARKYGVRSAMPISRAWALCSHAVFLPPQMEYYERVSDSIMSMLSDAFSLVERVSLDEAYIDATHLGSFANALRAARGLKRKIRERENLSCTCGIAESKMVAKIVCEQAKPDGLRAVLPSEAERFLDPLSIRTIPGVGPKAEGIIARMAGVERPVISDLRCLPQKKMEEELGVRGRELFEFARGRDVRPVEPVREARSVGREHTFEEDTRDPALLMEAFRLLLNEAEEARGGRKIAGVEVKVRFAGFRTRTLSRSFSEPVQDAPSLSAEAMRLFLRAVAESFAPFRLIGIRFRLAPPSGP